MRHIKHVLLEVQQFIGGERELWSARAIYAQARRPRLHRTIPFVDAAERQQLESRGHLLREHVLGELDRQRDRLAERQPGRAIARARRRRRRRMAFDRAGKSMLELTSASARFASAVEHVNQLMGEWMLDRSPECAGFNGRMRP
jgi:hypothetical protein